MYFWLCEVFMMRHSNIGWVALLVLALTLEALPRAGRADEAAPAQPSSSGQPPLASRTYRFTYAATVKGLAPGKTARVWIPLAQSGPAQDVTIVSTEVP